MEPSLDNAALERLREAVRDIREHDGGSVPHRALLALSESLGPGSRVTLDLRAAATIGVPLLVVGPARVPPPPELSPREQEVAALIADGLTNKGIALRLGLSPATVKDHVHRILQKTGLSNRAAIVAHLSR